LAALYGDGHVCMRPSPTAGVGRASWPSRLCCPGNNRGWNGRMAPTPSSRGPLGKPWTWRIKLACAMRIRRRRACVVQVSDRSEPDLARLLAGEMSWVESTVAELICPFSPRPIALEPDAVALLSQVSGDAYVAAEELAARTGASLERIAERAPRCGVATR